MGKQIDSLFIGQRDVIEIDKYLQRSSAIAFKNYTFYPKIERSATIHPSIADTNFTVTYISLKKTANFVKFRQIKHFGYFTVDVPHSPVIEVSNLMFDRDHQILNPMRLYVSASIQQPQEFADFVDHFFGWVRRKFPTGMLAGAPKRFRVSPDVVKFVIAGGKLRRQDSKSEH